MSQSTKDQSLDDAIECSSCRRMGADFECELCHGFVCKKCVQKLSGQAFMYLDSIPEKLSHVHYCGACFDQEVAPEQDVYNEILERAKGVYVFFKTQRKEIPLIKKTKEVLVVEGRPDRDETILRLAFMSAQKGFNALIDCEAVAKKLRNHAYQKHEWCGTGIAAQIDEMKLDRQDRQNAIYR
jgi:hypothetical protein